MHAHIHKYIYHVYILTCWRMWARRERWVAKTWPDTKKKYIYHVYMLTCWRRWARRERWAAKTWPDTQKKSQKQVA